METMEGLEHPPCEERLRDGVVQNAERETLIHLHKYLKGGDKEDKARLLSVVPSDRTGGHGPRLRRFPLNIRKYVFHGRMTNHWHRLPREVAQCPSKFSHMMEADHLEGSFVIRVTEHWHNCPERGCGISILQGIPKLTGHCPGQPTLCGCA